jgi:predicted nucleic-acid-binding Zn-ribbon protein
MISTGEFAAFLTEVGTHEFDCPFCHGKTAFMNVVADGVVAELHLPAAQSGAWPVQSHNFVSLSCQTCGYTQFFHSSAVHRWLGNRGLTKTPALTNGDK